MTSSSPGSRLVSAAGQRPSSNVVTGVVRSGADGVAPAPAVSPVGLLPASRPARALLPWAGRTLRECE
jgi:hypothetical protein